MTIATAASTASSADLSSTSISAFLEETFAVDK